MVAHHFSQALEYARASGQDPTPLSEPARFALREAGDRALGLNAFAAAERFYAAALELWPRDDEARPRLLLSLGRAQPQLERAQPALAEALEGLLALEDFEGAAEAELMLSNLSWYRGNRDEAYDHMVRAERFVEREGTSVIRARVLAELARYHTLGGRDEAAMIVGRQALEMAEALGLDSIRVSMLTYTGSARVRLGDVDGFADMRRAVEIGVEANLPEAARSYTNLAATLMHSGYLDDAIGAFDEGRRFGENFGPSDTLAWLRDQKLGGVALHRGEWDTAVARADELIAGDPHYRQRSAFTVRGLIRLARADPEGALDDAERGVALARAAKDPQAVVPALNALAFIRVGVGMGAEADSLATEVLDLDPVRNEVGAILFFLFWTLRALDRVGELETALAGARPDNRWHAGAQALLRGEFTRAAEIYSEAGSRLLEAYALLQAAEDGQPSAQLGKAIAFFREVRATAWLERAESLVEATA